MSVKASEVVEAARSILGASYVWWQIGDPLPKWYYQYPDGPPPRSWVFANGIHCLPGNTKVLAKGIEKSYRRVYSGELVTIKTASGNELSGTPNHPVLTAQGWIGLGELTKADRVFSSSGFGEFCEFDMDNKHEPTQLQEVHGSLVKSGALERIDGSPLDFHGDGGNSEVDVVSAYSQLQDRTQSTTSQKRLHLTLAPANLRKRALISQSMASADLFLLPASPTSFIGGSGNSLPFFRGGADVAQLTGLGNSTPRTALLEAPVHDALSNPQTGSDFSLSLSGNVTPDQIIDIKRYAFHGPVYNLQTTSGHYIANGIITHNCADFISYARQLCGLPAIGGTGDYQDWLEANGGAAFDPSTPGVAGALCVHRYEGPYGSAQGHVSMFVDENHLIQATSMYGVNEGEHQADSHAWANYYVYGLMPDVDYGEGVPDTPDTLPARPLWEQFGWYEAINGHYDLVWHPPED